MPAGQNQNRLSGREIKAILTRFQLKPASGFSTEQPTGSLLQTRALQGRDKRGGAARVLERIDDTPVHHVLLGAMGQLRFAEEKLHITQFCTSRERRAAAGSGQIHCKAFEIGKRAIGQSSVVSGPQNHTGRLTCFECLLPTGCT
jgi:hypothetical protein